MPGFTPKNVITRSLGPHPEVAIDLEGPFPVQPGDVFLLCSDGLSGQVEDAEIGMILGSLPPEQAARALVDLANLRGGPDNITVIVVQVTGPQVAAGGAEASPASKPSVVRPVHPVLWVLLGVFGLAAAGLALIGYFVPALVSLLVAAGAGVAALVQRFGAGDNSFDGRRLGRGPYADAACLPNAAFVERLAGTIEELHEAASSEDWQIDWSRFNAHREQARASLAAGDAAMAVRHSCLAISFMMRQLKSQRGRRRNGGLFGPELE